MKLPLAAALMALSSPAFAEVQTFDCAFEEACRQGGMTCSPSDSVHQYTVDTETGTGTMMQQDQVFNVDVLHSGDALHFVFANQAGIEMATIAPGGDIVFLGNLILGSSISHYRLTGSCVLAGPAPVAAPEK